MIRRLLVPLFALGLAAACGAPSSHGGTDGGEPPAKYTWYRDVLPITQTHCQGCHVQGGIAPFTLATYESAKAHNVEMASAVAARIMPPWKPDPACNQFQDERRLTQAEIDTIVEWSGNGAAEGDPKDAPAAYVPPPPLERIDQELYPPFQYTPQASSDHDDYHCFVLDPQLGSARDVIAYQVLPGAANTVHHVLLFAVDRTSAQTKNAQNGNLGWTCFGGPEVGSTNPKVVGGWVPGQPAIKYPENTGIRIKTSEVYVMQIHYNLDNAAAAPDQTSVQFEYSPQPVQKPALIFPLYDDTFSIPPNTTGYTDSSVSASSPVAATLYGVLPHMHKLGREIKVEADDGTCIIDIPHWDFHWQQMYLLKTPISRGAGTTMKLTCTWDNGTNRTITWGESTIDEMCLAYGYATVP